MSDVPQVIHRYDIVERLGRGGMGEVFLARDPTLDRYVAIKVLLTSGFEVVELRERFAREARSAARLTHANIVTIYDIGDHQGQPYIAMEYVNGQTLHQKIQHRTALSLASKLKYLDELCAGLGHAHRAGIVHRDIKPANLIISADDVLKILDFGIARLADSNMTQAGMLMGTLNYMSPEQISGMPVDHRSDIFAVGAVCYELLSYRQAFPGSMDTGVLGRIMEAATDPLPTVVPGLDERLVALVHRALAKNPADRFPDLKMMRVELAHIRERLDPRVLQSSADDAQTIKIVRTDTPLRTPQSTPHRAASRREIERRRAEEIASFLTTAREEFAAGRFEEVSAACERVLILEPAHEEANALIDRARMAIEQNQIREWMTEGRAELARGNFARARDLASFVLSLDTTSEEARALENAVEQALHAEAAKTAIARGRAALDGGDAIGATVAARDALRADPGNADAESLRREAEHLLEQQRRKAEHNRRARDIVAAARRRFATEPAEALALLQSFAPPHSEVTELLQELRAARDRELERIRQEQQARLKAEEESRQRAAAEAKRKAAEEAKRQAEEQARQRAEEEERRRAEQQAREQAEAEARARQEAAQRKAEEEAREQAAAAARIAKEKEEEERRRAEQQARQKAEAQARAAQEAARRKAEEEAREKAAAAARAAKEKEEEERRRAEQQARQKAEAQARAAQEAARRKAEEEAREKAAAAAQAAKEEEEKRRKAEQQAREKAAAEARAAKEAQRAADKARQAEEQRRAAHVREANKAARTDVARTDETILLPRATAAAPAAADSLAVPVPVPTGTTKPGVGAPPMFAIGAAMVLVLAIGVGVWRWTDGRDTTSEGAPAADPPTLGSTETKAAKPEPPREESVPPAKPPIEPVAEPAAKSPPVADESPASPTAVAPGIDLQLEPLRRQARQQLQRNQRVQALETIEKGLRLSPTDSQLVQIAAPLLRDAQNATARSKQTAISAGAQKSAAAVFNEGLRKEAEATGKGRTDRVGNIRSLWAATESFDKAGSQARELTAKVAAEEATRLREAEEKRLADEKRLAEGKRLAEEKRVADAKAKELADAQARQKEIAEREAKQKEQAKLTATPPATPAVKAETLSPAGPPAGANDEEAVHEALRRYEAAYETLDVAAVSRVYPGAPANQLAAAFRQYRAVDVQILVQSMQFSATRTNVTIAARVTYGIQPVSGRRVSNTVAQQFTLQKDGNTWRIDGIR